MENNSPGDKISGDSWGVEIEKNEEKLLWKRSIEISKLEKLIKLHRPTTESLWKKEKKKLRDRNETENAGICEKIAPIYERIKFQFHSPKLHDGQRLKRRRERESWIERRKGCCDPWSCEICFSSNLICAISEVGSPLKR